MKKIKYKVIILAIFLVFIGIYMSIPDGKLRLIFCDVLQGDGAIVTRGNWQMLIDVGADNGKMLGCLDKYVPFWDKKIEGIIISHWDKDHSGALGTINKYYQVERLYESTASGEKKEENIETVVLRAGDTLKHGKIFFEVIYPIETGVVGNENSLVLVMNYGGKKMMFAGDVDVDGEAKMMGWWKDNVEGIKISHHGSDTASSGEWLERIRPGVAIVSVGKNSYGHPTELVLGRLKSLGVKVYRTDIQGNIVLGWN
jgi:competence protein ComEC